MSDIEYIKPPRKKQPFVRVPKRTEPVALFMSQLLDRALGTPDYVEIAVKANDDRTKIVLRKAESNSPYGIKVRRYQYGRNTGITRIPGLHVRRILLAYGYREGERIYMKEVSPGVWEEV
jgi:hypothetical protein